MSGWVWVLVCDVKNYCRRRIVLSFHVPSLYHASCRTKRQQLKMDCSFFSFHFLSFILFFKSECPYPLQLNKRQHKILRHTQIRMKAYSNKPHYIYLHKCMYVLIGISKPLSFYSYIVFTGSIVFFL